MYFHEEQMRSSSLIIDAEWGLTKHPEDVEASMNVVIKIELSLTPAASRPTSYIPILGPHLRKGTMFDIFRAPTWI